MIFQLKYVSMLCLGIFVLSPSVLELWRCKHFFEMYVCLAVEGVQGVCKRCMFETKRSKKCLIMRHERKMCMNKQEEL